MDLQFVKNISSDGVADLFLFGEIGGPRGISGAQFAQEIQFLNDVENAKKINVHINSPGGIVFDGLSIIQAIMTSRAPVTTIIAGIAASIAGVIAMSGKTRKINDFAKLMIHGAQFTPEEGETMSARDKEAIAQVQGIIATIFKNNSRKSETDIQAVLQREVWFNAELALDWGFVDEIIDTDRKVGLEGVENNLMAIYNVMADALKPENQTQNSITMKKVTNHLNLQEGANEDQVVESVKTIENNLVEATTAKTTAEERVTELEGELEAEKTKVTDLETKVTDGNTAAIENFVDTAIAAGKYKADDKADLIVQATNNFEVFKTLTEKVEGKIAHADLSNLAGTQVPAEGTEGGLPKLREMEKKDPVGLDKIRNEQPEKFALMYEAEYGVKLPAVAV